MFGKSYKLAVPRGLYVVLCSTMLLLIMGAPAQARSLPTRHVRQAVISGQARILGLLPATQTMRLNIVLPPRDQAGLEKFLQEVYDPSSPSYRHFLTVPEFTERFGPTQDDCDAVTSFAKANGMTVTNVAPNRMVIELAAPVAGIERAFHLRMRVYQHPTEDRTFYAPDREPTPDLNVALWHIGGLDTFSVPHPQYTQAATSSGVQSNTTGSGPGGSFLGSDRRAAYYGGTTLTGSGQSVGLFQLDGFSQSDVQAYFNTVGQSLNVPINKVLLLGASGDSDSQDLEQVIDIIEAVSMAPALSQVRVYIAPLYPFYAGYNDTTIFNQMATDNIAKQLSCSWTWDTADPSSNDGIFAELASQGQNLFVASGDWGSYPNSSGYYYPAEDAHVTTVGGTDLTTNGAGGSWASEVAWGDSGGGYSQSGILIPSYQQLSGVINSLNNGSTVYRNAPDVAAEANGDNFFCANGYCAEGLGGTSLAAPTWAGYMALVNQQAVANGIGPIGFINPTIYSIGVGSGYSAAFHDITSGSNGGFSATVGYDLVTGWGSPNGVGLINALAGPSAPPDFTVSADPNSYNGYVFDSPSFTINITRLNGFTDTVDFTIQFMSGWPQGISYYMWPYQVTGSETATVYATTSLPGWYSLLVTAYGGGKEHQVVITINAAG